MGLIPLNAWFKPQADVQMLLEPVKNSPNKAQGEKLHKTQAADRLQKIDRRTERICKEMCMLKQIKDTGPEGQHFTDTGSPRHVHK